MSNALLDALGYVGAAIDKPGRAVRGVLAGRPEEALAAVPFSDALGITDENNRVSGSQLLKHLGIDAGDGLGGTLAGIGTELATDPLTWMGAGLGGLLGKRAGAAAIARGPQYETTADDFARMLAEKGWDNGSRRSEELLRNPQAARALSEVHPQSSILGEGAEAMAFAQPDGTVVRIGKGSQELPGRPIADGVLGTTRAVDIPYHANGSALRVERSPLATDVWSPDAFNMGNEIDDVLRPQGLSYGDKHGGNIGRVNGRPVVIDPGAVDDIGFKGARESVALAAEPSALMRRLLDMTDARDLIRAGQSPNFTMPFARIGGAAGAGSGAAGRTLEDF